MKQAWQLLKAGVAACVGGVGNLVLWSLWLGLTLLLVLQLYIVSTNELTVPGFLLRRLEARLAESGVRVEFKRTSFDPTGRVLLEEVRVLLPTFAEPVLTARAVYARLNPWKLSVGQFEARELRLIDAALFVPAMLSDSGNAQEMVQDLDVTVVPEDRRLLIEQLSARAAGVEVSAHGFVPVPRGTPTGTPELVGLLAQRFPAFCRQATALAAQLAAFEQPSLDLEITASDAGAVVVNVALLARRARLEVPVATDARDVRVATRALLVGSASTSQLEFAAAEVSLPFQTKARRLQGQIIGGVRQDGTLRFEPRQVELTLGTIARGDFSAEAVSAEVLPRGYPRIEGSVVGHVGGAPVAVRATADLTAQSADLAMRGELSQRLLTPLSQQLGVDVRRYFDFEELFFDDARLRLDPGWKFRELTAQVDVRNALAYGIRMESGRATIELNPTRFHSPAAFARIGDNFAHGSYEQDFGSNRFRFLLNGQLRPLDISGWFRPWWANFFQQFDFTASAPVASVDVNGVWREGAQSAVFVFAEVPRSIVRGVELDALQTRLFVRPGFYDGLEVRARTSQGSVNGTFTYELDWDSRDWRRLDLDLGSTLPLATIARMIGPTSTSYLEPFKLQTAPTVSLRARFDGPGSPAGPHQTIDATVRTTGELHFHQFPVQDATFGLKIRDTTIDVDNVVARFASGAVGGRARVWNENNQRRVGFDFSVKDASLGEGVATLQSFFARRRGAPPPPPGKFVQEKANVRVDLDASAEGDYRSPFSYQGSGNAVLRGAEIGAVPLFGSLSELLSFTTLRFTEARGTFKIEGPQLSFTEVTLRGANSAIDGHGIYALDAQALDFNAKVFPFQESENLVKTVVGAVLAPLSNAMEVKLTGSLENPEWRFALFGSPVSGPAVAERADPTTDGPPPPPSLSPIIAYHRQASDGRAARIQIAPLGVTPST
jgi:hypothetical protein